ncbi:MAG: PQQ-binding-like beta-propeller repeat protein [Chloroflexota bacterium]|nr:PQQ-binding-like beta-propeller repeat protein [Chloroflexota bacterium]
MSKQDDLFRPERIDEQIELLSDKQTEDRSFSSGAHLISDLRLIYEEDNEIVDQVWERLVERAPEKRRAITEQRVGQSRSPQKMREDRQEGYQPMKLVSTEKRSHKSLHMLEMLAAVIIIAAVVGSMILVLQKKQTLQTHLGSSGQASTTSTATATNTATGLYLSTVKGVYKVSLQTGKVLWHIPLSWAGKPFIMGDRVLFNGANSSNAADEFLQAVSATTGKQLWRKNYGPATFLLPAHGILYDSSCLQAPNGESSGCYIYAINPANGTLLWSFSTFGSTAWMTVQDNVVYGAAFTNLFALDATTGRPLWQKKLAYPNQEPSFTPLVINHVLYTASCNYTKLTSGYLTCYFLAFNATNGTEKWHTHVNRLIFADPAGADGVIYYGTNMGGHVYAVNASTGSVTWTYTACTGDCGVASMEVVQGILYLQIQINSSTSPIVALNLANRRVLWSKNLGSSYATSYRETWMVDRGLVYVAVDQNRVEMLNARNGAVIKSYRVAALGTIFDFTVVP